MDEFFQWDMNAVIFLFSNEWEPRNFYILLIFLYKMFMIYGFIDMIMFFFQIVIIDTRLY